MNRIPDHVEIVSLDQLVVILRAQQLIDVLVVGPLVVGRQLFDDLASRVRVRQRWFAAGAERFETDAGVTVRLVSSSHGSQRGQAADLVVVLNDDRVPDAQFVDAEIVVASRGGRVVVL